MKRIKIITFLTIIWFFIHSTVFANDTLVYVDRHDIDTRYHRLTCSFIPKEYQAISVETAFAEGFRSCPICEPPISNAEQKLKDEEYQERLAQAKNIINSVSTPTTNTSTTYDSNSDDRTVYITRTGAKYHMSGCDYLDNTPYKLTIAEAESKGYAPCKVCNPYGLAPEKEESNSSNIFIFILVIALTVFIIYIIFNEIKYKKNRMGNN